MKVTKTTEGKKYTIQADDVLFFVLAVVFGTLISAGTLRLLGLI